MSAVAWNQRYISGRAQVILGCESLAHLRHMEGVAAINRRDGCRPGAGLLPPLGKANVMTS